MCMCVHKHVCVHACDFMCSVRLCVCASVSGKSCVSA